VGSDLCEEKKRGKKFDVLILGLGPYQLITTPSEQRPMPNFTVRWTGYVAQAIFKEYWK